MNSKYIKELEEEIKKTKAENDFHFNLSKKKIDKIALKEKLNIINSNSKNEQEENKSLNIKNKRINDYEKLINENNSKNDTVELENNNKDINNIELKEKEINLNIDNNKEKNGHPYFSKICHCCNKEFDMENQIPFLLKCNHIFCKKCLENYFTNEEGIKCPIDGLMGKSISDIQLLNIIPESEKTNSNSEYKINNQRNKKNPINLNMHSKSNSNKELIRNKPKDLNLKNNYIINTYDKIKNYIINDKKIKHSKSTNKKKNSFAKIYSNNDGFYKPFNKNASFIGNNNINISQIKSINNNNNNNAYDNNNIDEKYSLENSENNSEYNNNSSENNQNFCNFHPEQKITHFVEDTKELICIHCAFNKLKTNPNAQIKEIPEKCKEYLNDLDTIIENNQKCCQIIHNSLNDINENKENEEKKLIEIYEQLLNILVTNRNNYLIKIEEIYQENTNNMNKKLENFAEIIDIAEKLKEDFSIIYDKAPYEFNNLTQAFNKFIREINDKNNSDLEIIQYNFSHDDLNKVIKYLNDFADVKTRKKTFRFDLLKNSKNNITIEEINNTNGYINNSIYKNGINNYFKKSKDTNRLNLNNKNFAYCKINNINFRNTSNDIDMKNNSILNNSNNKVRFKFKYEEEKDNKYSTILSNNNFLDSNNIYNGTNSENIDTINRYIASTNMIRDNLYNQPPIANFKNAKNRGSNSVNYNNRKFNESLKNDKLEILNKYKIPHKRNKNK